AVLPIPVVVRMRHHVVPVGLAGADASFVTVGDLFQAAYFQEIVITVLCIASFPWFDVISIAGWPGHRLKTGVKPKILCQKQSSIVMHVVAVKPIADGCLRRASL